MVFHISVRIVNIFPKSFRNLEYRWYSLEYFLLQDKKLFCLFIRTEMWAKKPTSLFPGLPSYRFIDSVSQRDELWLLQIPFLLNLVTLLFHIYLVTYKCLHKEQLIAVSQRKITVIQKQSLNPTIVTVSPVGAHSWESWFKYLAGQITVWKG